MKPYHISFTTMWLTLLWTHRGLFQPLTFCDSVNSAFPSAVKYRSMFKFLYLLWQWIFVLSIQFFSLEESSHAFSISAEIKLLPSLTDNTTSKIQASSLDTMRLLC